MTELVSPTTTCPPFEAFCTDLFARLDRPLPATVHRDLDLVDDLGFDSLELLELVIAVEQATGSPLPDALVHQLRRLGDAYEWFLVKRDQEGPAPPPSRPEPGTVPLATRRVTLRAVTPPDHEWLYELTTRADNLVRWRDRGATHRIEAWIDRLWAGVAAQFVVQTADDDVGLVTLYHHDARNGHARLAAIFDDRRARPGPRLEGVALLVNYGFEVFDLRKCYAEVVGFNFVRFASGLGWAFVEEGRLLDYEYAHGRHWPVHLLATDRSRFATFCTEWLPELAPADRS